MSLLPAASALSGSFPNIRVSRVWWRLPATRHQVQLVAAHQQQPLEKRRERRGTGCVGLPRALADVWGEGAVARKISQPDETGKRQQEYSLDPSDNTERILLGAWRSDINRPGVDVDERR